MYYWDGRTWVSTLAYDGRSRWNGTAWVPVTGQPLAYSPYHGKSPRQPTSWTRPMQLAVAGWYAISALYTLTLPLWMGGLMTTVMNQSFQRQQELSPTATPPPPELIQTMTTFLTGVVWVSALLGAVICGVVIAGALKRWTWTFYVVLVLLGLSALSGPLNLINIFAAPAYSSAVGYSFPTAFYVVGLIAWVPSTALFVWMLIAVIKRGPWAMARAPQS
jgi:hypothetical protein